MTVNHPRTDLRSVGGYGRVSPIRDISRENAGGRGANCIRGRYRYSLFSLRPGNAILGPSQNVDPTRAALALRYRCCQRLPLLDYIHGKNLDSTRGRTNVVRNVRWNINRVSRFRTLVRPAIYFQNVF